MITVKEDSEQRQGVNATKTGRADSETKRRIKTKNRDQRVRKDKDGQKKEKRLPGFHFCFPVKKSENKFSRLPK